MADTKKVRRGCPPDQVISSELVALSAPRSLPAAFTDAKWLAKHSAERDTRYFAWTTAELIAYVNQRLDIGQVLPLEQNGYARASWRDERTPGVKVYPVVITHKCHIWL